MVTWNEGVSGDPASGFEVNFDPTPGPVPCVVRVKAGDRLAIPVTFIDDTTEAAIPQTSDNWGADVRARPSAEATCAFTVDTTDKATGVLVLRMEPELSALMRYGMKTDVVDLDAQYTWFTIQWDVWGDYTHA